MPGVIRNVTGPIEEPKEMPEREGYRFDGWFREPEMVNQWNFSHSVTGDMILYARWSLAYNVIFDPNAGGALVENMPGNLTGNYAVTSGWTFSEPAEIPTRAGFKFDGWFKEAAAVNPWNFAVDTVTQDTTLFAKWVALWSVTFNAGGDDVDNMPANLTNIVNGSVITRPSDPTRTGYTFINWFREPMGTIPWNFAADTVTSNINLHARWNQQLAGQGQVAFTLRWLDEQNTFAEISGDTFILSRRDGDSITITVDGANGNPLFFMVNGVRVPGNPHPYVFSATTRVNGFYDLQAVIQKDGRFYSAGFRVRVID
jgi:uncharacterized repeat protein (TIGR02543 family)